MFSFVHGELLASQNRLRLGTKGYLQIYFKAKLMVLFIYQAINTSALLYLLVHFTSEP